MLHSRECCYGTTMAVDVACICRQLGEMVEAYREKVQKGKGQKDEEGDDDEEDGTPRLKQVPPTSAYVRFVWQVKSHCTWSISQLGVTRDVPGQDARSCSYEL